MKFIKCKQGTPEWLQARAGLITASCFTLALSTVGGLDERQKTYVTLVRDGMDEKAAMVQAGYKVKPSSDIIRRALAGEQTEEQSDVSKRYAADITFERIAGAPYGEPPKAWLLERGHELEEEARRKYEVRSGSMVSEAGLCVTDDDLFGYSTDGLVDNDGLVEVKAPIDSVKIIMLWQFGDLSEYMDQMQGGMWITGRKWCDFIMYAPHLAKIGKDLYVKRVFRDDAYIDSMADRLVKFAHSVEVYEALLRNIQAPAATPAAPVDGTPEWMREFV